MNKSLAVLPAQQAEPTYRQSGHCPSRLINMHKKAPGQDNPEALSKSLAVLPAQQAYPLGDLHTDNQVTAHQG